MQSINHFSLHKLKGNEHVGRLATQFQDSCLSIFRIWLYWRPSFERYDQRQVPMKILHIWTFRVADLFWHAGLTLLRSQARKSQPYRSKSYRCVRFSGCQSWWQRSAWLMQWKEEVENTAKFLRRWKHSLEHHRSSSFLGYSTSIWSR